MAPLSLCPLKIVSDALYNVRSPSLSELMESRWNRNVNSLALASLPLTPCISLALCSLRRIWNNEAINQVHRPERAFKH